MAWHVQGKPSEEAEFKMAGSSWPSGQRWREGLQNEDSAGRQLDEGQSNYRLQ